MSEWRSALVWKKLVVHWGRAGLHRLGGTGDFVPNCSCGAQNAGKLNQQTWRNSPNLYCI